MGRAEAFYAIHILTSDDTEQVGESPRLTGANYTLHRHSDLPVVGSPSPLQDT